MVPGNVPVAVAGTKLTVEDVFARGFSIGTSYLNIAVVLALLTSLIFLI